MEREMDAELRFHIESFAEDLVRSGVPCEEALRRARIEFGGIERAKEECRDARGVSFLDSVLQDLRFALRMLRKNPGFTAVGMLTLGIGIGANAAIFSVAQGFLLKPLALPQEDRLVAVGELQANDRNDTIRVSPANYLDWVSQSHSFDHVSAFDWGSVNLNAGSVPFTAQGIRVSAGFFEALGVKPLLGRIFLPDEDQPGHEKELILTRGLWEREFGSDANAIGKTVRIDGSAYTVVGVMDKGCKFPQSVELWLPLALEPQARRNRQDRFLQVMAHLKPGIAREQAFAEMKTISGRLSRQYPEANRNWTVQVIPLRDYAVFHGSAPFMFLLMGTAGLVLLIACANVANLLLARATGRRKEIAVRAALGAGRWRVARQLLCESLVLGLLGSIVGLLLAKWAIYLFLANMPPELERFVAGWDQIRLDAMVFLFAMVVAATAGILAGLAPALQSRRPDLNAVLKEGVKNSSDGGSRHRVRSAIVVAQVSLALILMIGSGLMVKGFRTLLDTNRRFQPESLLALRLVLPDSPTYKDPHRRAAFYDQTLQELSALPGVRSAALVTGFPFSGLMNDGTFSIEGQPVTDAGAQRFAVMKDISANYFETMGVALREGRPFNDLDGAESRLVAIVSERFARLYFPSESPLGHRIKTGAESSSESWLTIVGVVRDIKYNWSASMPEPVVYRPYRQAPPYYVALGLRTEGDPASLVPAARLAVTRVSRDQPIFNTESLDRVIRDNTLPIAYVAAMMAAAGLLALLLASIGVYGVMAYSVVERTHEIGVRIVVGAGYRDVVRLVLRRGVLLMVLGFATGLPCAYGLARLEANLLAGISASDFWAFSWVTAVLAVASLLACYIPARRAMKVDPMVALKYE